MSHATRTGKAAAVLLWLTTAVGCAINPVSGRRELALVSESQLPSSIPLAELAIINGLEESAQLRAGQSIKRVTGAPAPRVTSTR